jgi:Ca-activated chloride channel family protein
MKRYGFLPILAVLLATASPVFSAGLVIVEDPAWLPGPQQPWRPMPPPWQPPQPPIRPPMPRPITPIEISSVKVQTRINDQIAVTEVDQEFFNPNPSRLEGTFLFPVPKGAHLDKFTMEIDGRNVEAELLSADKATRYYEDIVRKLRDPGLLEYAGQDVFKVRIFPMEPNSRKKVTVSYTQLLRADGGLVNYLLPLAAGKHSARPIKSLSVKIDLETRRPLKSIYSPTHAIEVKRRGPTSATAGFEAADAQPESDLALYFAAEKDDVGLSLLTHKAPGEDGYFLLLASPGLDSTDKRSLPKDVVFVLDTSGSMAGKKMEQAKKALEFCVENLNDNDRFEIIRFSTEVEPLFEKLVPASKINRARAGGFIQELKATGATAIDDALKKALASNPSVSSEPVSADSRPFVVVFLTDGRPTIGTTDEDEIISNLKKSSGGRTRIFCFGIGTDVNTHLLDRIGEETRAFSQYVLPDEDLEIKVSSFFSKIKEPVLANPSMKLTGDVHPAKLYPSALPDLFKGEQMVLVGRYTGSGDSAVIVSGSVNGAARKFTYESNFPAESARNDFIPRLWATRRVGYLLDEIRLHGENSELRDEVTELARKYGIVTPYTAYLILEDETRRRIPEQSRSFQYLERDKDAREQAAVSWNGFKTDTVGDGAIADARSTMMLKEALAAAPAAVGGRLQAQRALGLPDVQASPLASQPADTPEQSTRARLAQYASQTRFVAGKNFFLNGNQWMDAGIQKHPAASRTRIQFGSAEYYDWMSRNPEALPWLSLGKNLQFVLGDRIVEIYE